MRIFAIAAVWALFVGCDYTVPLVTKPEIKIDKAVLGLWQAEEKKERLLVLPLGETEYLVCYPSEDESALFARTCLGKVGEQRVAQLRWFGTAQGAVIEDPRAYQYVSFSVVEDALTVRLLNSTVVPKNVASTEELQQAIAKGIKNPALFQEPMVFRRVKD